MANGRPTLLALARFVCVIYFFFCLFEVIMPRKVTNTYLLSIPKILTGCVRKVVVFKRQRKCGSQELRKRKPNSWHDRNSRIRSRQHLQQHPVRHHRQRQEVVKALLLDSMKRPRTNEPVEARQPLTAQYGTDKTVNVIQHLSSMSSVREDGCRPPTEMELVWKMMD
jgi:hypothetical protein